MQTKFTLFKFTLILILLWSTSSIFSQSNNCQLDTLSSVCFDLDDCHSFSGDNSATDYSEFVGDVENHPMGSQFNVVGNHLYVNDPVSFPHSCTPGNNGTSAMCISASHPCNFVDDSDGAVRFDIELTPGQSGVGSLSCLSFYEAAPEFFSWNGGVSGLNNYPQEYGVRVTVNGVEVFKQIDINTTYDYSLEVFDFSNNPSFTVTQPTIFSFELYPYCTVGNGGFVHAWDLEDIKVYEKVLNTNIGGDLVFTSNGQDSYEICEGQEDQIFMTILNQMGSNSAYVVTNQNGDVVNVSANPIDITALQAGVYTIYHISYDSDCGEILVDTDQNVVSSGAVTLDLEDSNCAEIAAFSLILFRQPELLICR